MRVCVALWLVSLALAGPAEDFAEGQALHAKGEWSEAIVHFERARDQYRAGDAAAAAAVCESYLGICHEALGDRRASLRAHRAALAGLLVVHGDDDHLDLARALKNVGHAFPDERPQAALPYYERSLAMYARLGVRRHPSLAGCLNDHGACLVALGRLHEALTQFSRAAPMVPSNTTSQQWIATCLADLGRFDEAVRIQERVVAERARLHGRADERYLASVDSLLAMLGRAGRREAAVAFLRGLIRSWETKPSAPRARAVAQWELAKRLRGRGLHGEAELLLEAAAKTAQTVCDKDDRFPPMLSCTRALAWIEHGRAEAAIPLLVDARSAASRRKDRSAEAFALLLLTRAYLESGQDRSAERSAREACAACRETGSALLPIALSNLAAAVQGADGIRSVEEALAWYRSHGDVDSADRAVALVNAGRRHEKAGATALARDRYRDGVAMAQRLRVRNRHQLIAKYGWFRLRQGEVDAAQALFADAIGLVEMDRREAAGLSASTRASYAGVLARGSAYDGMANIALKRGRVEEALRYLEQGRARALLDVLERSRFDLVREAARRASLRGDKERLEKIRRFAAEAHAAHRTIDRLDHTLVAARASAEVPPKERRELEEALASARARRSAVLARRDELIGDVAPFGRPETPEVIRRLVRKGEALLYYSFTPNGGRVLLVPAPGEAVSVFELEMPVDDVRRGLVAVRARLGLARGVGKARAAPAPPVVPPALWAKIRKLDRVYVVPHGPLHRVPLEALPVDGKPWIDHGPPLVYVASASVLAACRARGRRPRAQRYDIVAVGDPAFADPALARLPGTGREVETIASLYPKRAVVLTGAAATERALASLAPQTRILHLATHLVVDHVERERDTGLALADGKLTILDLLEGWRDTLSSCELVVLSACETKLGPHAIDEAPQSMPTGFLYAGAPAVIASLWRVDDASTAKLFAKFYEELKAGKGKLEAFTQARKWLKEKYPDPYHWAPFVFIGDPR